MKDLECRDRKWPERVNGSDGPRNVSLGLKNSRPFEDSQCDLGAVAMCIGVPRRGVLF